MQRCAITLLALVGLAACGGDNSNNTPPVDGAVPDPDAAVDADTGPQITEVSYEVIAHGGELVITGANLAGATQVDIGGVAHTDLANVSDTSVTVTAVDDTVPTGAAQDLTVTTPEGTSAPFSLAVIHLIISELEPDSPGADVADFVEIDTGVAAALSLDGYVMVHVNGADGSVAEIVDLDASTADTGLMLLGPATLVATPQIVYDAGFQTGEDAVAIYQFAPAPNAFPGNISAAGTDGLIDAVIYESGADTDAPALSELTTDAAVVQLGLASDARETTTIQRCPADLTRRLGASFVREIPTPGRANVNCDGVADLADCTVDFDAVCPNAVAGDCGAIFVPHAAAVCEENGNADCVGTGDGFRTSIDNNGDPDRLDIFLTGNLNTLQLEVAPLGGTDATMTFFDIDGNQVGTPLTVAADCAAGTAITTQTATLDTGAIRRIEVTGDAEVVIDNFHVNP